MAGIASALFLAVHLLPSEERWSHIPPIGAHSANRAHIALLGEMLVQLRSQRLGQPQIHFHKPNILAVIVTLRLVQIRVCLHLT